MAKEEPGRNVSVLRQLGLLILTPCAWALAQQAAETVAPAGSIERGFTRVAGVRELTGGRAIVVDASDRTVFIVDFRTGSVAPIGRPGAGPGEYAAPSRVFALDGRRSAILDAGNGRLAIVDSAGRPAGSISLRAANTGSTLPPSVEATDERGYRYGLAQAVKGTSLTDSAAIERWTDSSRKRDTVGFLPVQHRVGASVHAGMVVSPAANAAPFATGPQWAIAPDGRVAVVTANPYQVAFYDASARRSSGPPLMVSPVRVTEGEKQTWRSEQRRPRSATVVGRGTRQENQVVQAEYREPDSWPEYLPPFLPGAIRFAPDGILWIERTTKAGDPPTFDLVDAQSRIVRRIQIPAGARLVGLGAGAAYAVTVDQDDLERLRRYAIPSRR